MMDSARPMETLSVSVDSHESHDEDSVDSKKRPRDDLNDDDRREERKAANRRSAFQSRLRKKLLIEELQQKVNKLQEEMTLLKENNRTLTLGLEASLAENRRLRFLQQHASASGGGVAGLSGGGLSGGLSGGGLAGLQNLQNLQNLQSLQAGGMNRDNHNALLSLSRLAGFGSLIGGL